MTISPPKHRDLKAGLLEQSVKLHSNCGLSSCPPLFHVWPPSFCTAFLVRFTSAQGSLCSMYSRPETAAPGPDLTSMSSYCQKPSLSFHTSQLWFSWVGSSQLVVRRKVSKLIQITAMKTTLLKELGHFPS